MIGRTIALEQVHQLKHGRGLDVVVVLQAVLHVGEELEKALVLFYKI